MFLPAFDLQTGQHDAKMPLLHRQHRNSTTLLWSSMQPQNPEPQSSDSTAPFHAQARPKMACRTRSSSVGPLFDAQDIPWSVMYDGSAHPGQATRAVLSTVARRCTPLKLSEHSRATSGKKEGTREQGVLSELNRGTWVRVVGPGTAAGSRRAVWTPAHGTVMRTAR